ncbi:MAG: YdcF family protein [Thermoflexales bacterium]|nr:YdcF family protein [Thermoflexales bacterium]
MSGFLIVADPLAQADALKPLGGGKERILQAAGLFEQGYAEWFVVTDMPLSVPGIRESYAELVKREAVWQGVPEARVLTAPGVVETTYEEALAVRQLAQERGWRSLLLVTSSYHTRRTQLIFRDVFRDTGVAIMVWPMDESWYDPASWWRSHEGLRETWTEYLKLVLYVLGYR